LDEPPNDSISKPRPGLIGRLHLFQKFDPRLAADLKTQRSTILKGLICTGITAALASSFIALLYYAVSILTKDQNAAAQKTGVDLMAVARVSAAIVLLYLFKYWFTRGQIYYLSRAAARLSSDLRTRLFDKLQRMPISYFSDRRVGSIQSIMTNDVGIYQSAVGSIRDSIDGPVRALGAFVMMIVLQPVLAGIAVLFLPPMVFVIQRNARKMKVAQARVQQDLADLNALAQEALQGNRVVKAFGAESTMGSIHGDLVERTFHSQMVAARRTASLRPMVELIGAVAVAIVVFISGVLTSRGLLSVAGLASSIFALDTINQGLRSLASVSNTYAQVEAAAQRIYEEILEQPDEHLDVRGEERIASPRGRLEFKNVSFSYPDGTPALRNVSFVIEPGTSLALVGASGAGKSTIADLVLRFYDPGDGAILLDGIDLRRLDVGWLRAQFGVVPQQTFLFAGTIEENVRLAAPTACDREVAEALEVAHAQEFVAEMSSRTSDKLGERGLKLSGGQMQRVAIARALVRKPTLLVLDEATSALDAKSEKIVTEALQGVMRGRTTLFIAHRLTTAARADRILHLRQGQVVEQGSHKELMEANGEYAALFRVFSSGLIEEIQ